MRVVPVLAVLAGVSAVDAKGNGHGHGHGVGGSTSFGSFGSRARGYRMMSGAGAAAAIGAVSLAGARGSYSTPGGRKYAPSYVGPKADDYQREYDIYYHLKYPNYPFRKSDGTSEGTFCGDLGKRCECPRPKEEETKRWVWAQVVTTKKMCATCGELGNKTDPQGTDASTFEIDAFLEISSTMVCTPPTTVLVLKVCPTDSPEALPDSKFEEGTMCMTVGAESESLYGRRRLLQQMDSPYYITQFVVGATSDEHGYKLEGAIEDATKSTSSLSKTYSINKLASTMTDPTPVQATISEDGMSVGGIVLAVVLPLAACLVVGIFIKRRVSKSVSQHTQDFTPDLGTGPSPYGRGATQLVGEDFVYQDATQMEAVGDNAQPSGYPEPYQVQPTYPQPSCEPSETQPSYPNPYNTQARGDTAADETAPWVGPPGGAGAYNDDDEC
eukprot:Hpha_TRINITY_DN16173_c2_g1::TRINITY_DN16173_c2_g1_i3::g.4344::m.4344